jgi:hypothetical protein
MIVIVKDKKHHQRKDCNKKISYSTLVNPNSSYFPKPNNCDENVVKVSQADIPLNITHPGRYCLTESIQWSNKVTNSITPAINIKASNVELDLNGYKIDLNNVSFRGVQVNDSANVVIKNGTIQNTTLEIRSEGPNSNPSFRTNLFYPRRENGRHSCFQHPKFGDRKYHHR